jgi:hypothetical protein
MSGYLWKVKDDTNAPFLENSGMFFFYMVNRNGFWAEGFASKFVNISREEALKMTSNAGVSEVGMLLVVPSLMTLSFLVLL